MSGMETLRSAVGTNRALARRATNELWGAGNLDAVEEIYAESVTLREGGEGPTVVDRPAIRRRYGEWRSGFPDLEVEIREEIADRDFVVQHVVLRGTHDGEFRGLAPTGRPVEVEGFQLRRFRDGRVVSTASLIDEADLLSQLGVDVLAQL